jgi:hypothetical protein
MRRHSSGEGSRKLGETTARKGRIPYPVETATRVIEKPASLSEAGIDKNLAQRAREMGAIPAAKFEELITIAPEGRGPAGWGFGHSCRVRYDLGPD